MISALNATFSFAKQMDGIRRCPQMGKPNTKLRKKSKLFLIFNEKSLSLHKIGITSAIRVSSIALGSHYLCI